MYAIRNTVNDKVYVGSGVSISNRWSVHIAGLYKGKHFNRHLLNAWNKYGPQVFTFETLERCEIHLLASREQYWIETLQAATKGYNILSVAYSASGRKHTEQARKKISLAATLTANTEQQRKLRSERAKQQHQENRFGRATWKPGSADRVRLSVARSQKLSQSLKRRWETNPQSFAKFTAKTSEYMRSLPKEEFARRSRCQVPGRKKAYWDAKTPAERAEHGQRVKEGMRRAAKLRLTTVKS